MQQIRRTNKSFDEPAATSAPAVEVPQEAEEVIEMRQTPNPMRPLLRGLSHVAIVSLSPTATEMLFAIGAGEQVIAG